MDRAALPLPFRSPLDRYEAQAADLLAGHAAGDPDALRFAHENHPRFLDGEVTWLPRPLSPEEIRAAAFAESDARLALARWYGYRSWDALVAHQEHVRRDGSPVARFETAVEAVVNGDVAGLMSLLRADPELARARSARVTPFDPPEHRATLLHYVAANGVEGHRQRSPSNAVDVARTLLDAGAEVDALAGFYGGQYATMSLLVSSTPPAEAGVQVPLVELLADRGAALEPAGSERWGSPLLTALAFGFVDAARALVRRGARVLDVAAAAGLGLESDAARLLPEASASSRHRALALAAQNGHAGIVRLLLDAGEDPNRFNPEGNHAHATPLHQAALNGHLEVVRTLVERGARTDVEDKLWKGTPLGWAIHGNRPEVEAYLRAAT